MLALIGAAQAAGLPDPKSWLSPAHEVPPQSKGHNEKVAIFIIPPETIDLLAKTQIVELTAQQLDRLSGGKAAPTNTLEHVQPYLVRGVSPNTAGVCNAGQEDGELTVFCGSLGDWRYEFRPVIVFLSGKPSRVWIGAMTAL